MTWRDLVAEVELLAARFGVSVDDFDVADSDGRVTKVELVMHTCQRTIRLR